MVTGQTDAPTGRTPGSAASGRGSGPPTTREARGGAGWIDLVARGGVLIALLAVIAVASLAVEVVGTASTQQAHLTRSSTP